MTDLDLSEWIEMCLHKIYTGPHAEEFIDGVREYEERIRKLEAKLSESEALLAKAVEALDGMVGLFSADNLLLRGTHLNMELTNARNTLSELRRTRR